MSDRQPTVNALLVDINGNPVGVTGGGINTSGSASAATGASTYAAAAQVTVGAAAVDLVVAGTYKVVIIRAFSTNTVSIFWGPTGVTTTTGMELKPGEEQIFTGTECPLTLLRGVAASAAQTAIVMTAA